MLARRLIALTDKNTIVNMTSTKKNLSYLSDMKILLAEEFGGHPFWNRNEYIFVIIDTEKHTAVRLDFNDTFRQRDKNWCYGAVEYYIKENGVYARFFACGSGYGKVPKGEEFLLIDKSQYDTVIILPNEEKRKAQLTYNGHWQDNSDFE